MSLKLCVVMLSLLLGAVRVEGASRWEITSLSLKSDTNVSKGLMISALKDGSTIDLTVTVRLTSIKEYFVSNGNLAVLGESGQAYAVVIVDLQTRRLSDWFFCREAKRISQNWIAMVEWYPDHGARWPTDVVLVYDLEKSPRENRLSESTSRDLPPAISDIPIKAGLPVYPTSNALEGSYTNVVAKAEDAINILGAPYFTLLSSKWLVFIAAKGKERSDMQNGLIVVDLSHGLIRPPSRIVQIPTSELKQLGENPGFIEVDEIDAVGPEIIRLSVPRAKYGVDGFIVDLSVDR